MLGLLVAVIGIIVTTVAVTDQIDAFGVKDIKAQIDDNTERISSLESHAAVTDSRLTDIHIIKEDLEWIKHYLIENGN